MKSGTTKFEKVYGERMPQRFTIHRHGFRSYSVMDSYTGALITAPMERWEARTEAQTRNRDFHES